MRLDYCKMHDLTQQTQLFISQHTH